VRVEPEAKEEVRREHRDMMAGGAIDLHEVALPEILDPRQIFPISSRVMALAKVSAC
jgi:hypothetical protein